MSTNPPSVTTNADRIRHVADTFSFWVLIAVLGLLILLAAMFGLTLIAMFVYTLFR